jgi:asparagine synthetase B (glutamine-hydrolysing)
MKKSYGAGMNGQVYLSGKKITLGTSNLFFHGYIKHKGSLLYDARAKKVIISFLQSHSLAELFRDINGSFQLIYLQDNKLFFSIDHFGGYSLFYQKSDSGIAIFDNPMQYKHKSSLSDTALCSIFAAGFTLGDETIFNGIKECQPGTLYSYDLETGRLDTEVWFSYYSTDSKSLDAMQLDEIADSLFPEVKDGNYTLSLSGGIDSRFLYGCLLKKEIEFRTFSFGTDLNEDKLIAEKLTSLYDTPFMEFDFTPELCSNYYTHPDTDFIVKNCTSGRSLPNETDLIPSYLLDPQTDIICKGFGGDFLTGRYITPAVRKLRTFESAVKYLFDKYFSLTCISGSPFRNLLHPHLLNSIQALYKANQKNIISTLEQWNLLHNERKYIVNTLAYYKALGFRFYLPFYDRNLMNFMAQLRFTEKTDQNAYFTYLREHFFTGKLAQLNEIKSLRDNFLSPVQPSLPRQLFNSAHNLLRVLDKQKIRKRYSALSQKEYADSLMLFTHSLKTLPYLTNRIGTNFPEIHKVSGFLQDKGCCEAAKHLHWLALQATAQININGLSLCEFFFNAEFMQVVKEHLSD